MFDGAAGGSCSACPAPVPAGATLRVYCEAYERDPTLLELDTQRMLAPLPRRRDAIAGIEERTGRTCAGRHHLTGSPCAFSCWPRRTARCPAARSAAWATCCAMCRRRSRRWGTVGVITPPTVAHRATRRAAGQRFVRALRRCGRTWRSYALPPFGRPGGACASGCSSIRCFPPAVWGVSIATIRPDAPFASDAQQVRPVLRRRPRHCWRWRPRLPGHGPPARLARGTLRGAAAPAPAFRRPGAAALCTDDSQPRHAGHPPPGRHIVQPAGWYPQLSPRATAHRSPLPGLLQPHARRVSTLRPRVHVVSPTYAKEICDPGSLPWARGCRPTSRRPAPTGRLHGILNGCEYPAGTARRRCPTRDLLPWRQG
jgi:hypothetical protein